MYIERAMLVPPRGSCGFFCYDLPILHISTMFDPSLRFTAFVITILLGHVLWQILARAEIAEFCAQRFPTAGRDQWSGVLSDLFRVRET